MYPKLEDRFAKTAGFHSGTERAIYADQGATAATHMHEMIHDRIFYETSDGMFHLLVHRLAEAAEETRVRAANKSLLRFLFDETRDAHEAAATYMGIVYLETYVSDEIYEEKTPAAEEYARLPPDYRHHYAAFGELLDQHIRAPWLRLSIAWSIAAWAFSSPRLSNAIQILVNRTVAPTEIPGPGVRLTSALRAIVNAGVAPWIRDVVEKVLSRCAENQIFWADMDNADEWPDVSGARKVEFTQAALFDVVREWLNARVANSWHPGQIGGGVRDLMIRHGFEFGERPDALPCDLEGSVLDARALVRAAERARVHRREPLALTAFNGDVARDFLATVSAESGALTILANFRWGRKKYRSILGGEHDEMLAPMALNANDLHGLLRSWRQCRVQRTIPAPVVVCELSLSSDVFSVVARKIARHGLSVHKLTPPLDKGAVGPVFVPVNYIETGLPSIMEHVRGTVYNIDVQIASTDGRSGVMLFIPDDPEIHACIKVVPRYDMGAYLVYQRALTERGLLKSAAPGVLHPCYRHMISAVLACWDPL